MKKITLGISGMSCAACSSAIEKHLNKQAGIISASVNLVMANATIEFDPQILTQKQIENFIKQAGYKSTGLYKLENSAQKFSKQKFWFVVFGVLTALVLYVSMGEMIGLPQPKILNMHTHALIYSSVLLTLTLPFLIYGFGIFKNGIKTLFHRAPNMDTLVTLGVLSSFGFSLFGFVMVALGHVGYAHGLYFESCCVIIYFIKLGRFVDGLSKNKTTSAIKQLVQITPNNAYVKVGGKLKQVTIDEIKKGDIVVCRAGEKIAVDGTVVTGNAHVDQAFITGESKPASLGAGAHVVAGSVNLDGYLEYTAEKIGKDSTVSEIVHMVVEATNTKMPLAKIADRVSGIFVPAIICLALAAFAFYLALGRGINLALESFVTVLVVACPCSLGLATPLAIVVSVGMCAKDGILVKKSETLELANKANVVVFDKTGTLTYGKLKLAKIINFSTLAQDEILRYACSLESKSTHPIGTAFADLAKQKNLKLFAVKNFKNLSGKGVVGTIRNKTVLMGNSKLLSQFKIKNTHKTQEVELAKSGNSLVYLAIENQIIALFGVNDMIKDGAKQLIERLNRQRIETIMLTGDNETTAKQIANQLGITRVIANVLPAEKARVIQQLKAENKVVVMCGDGINDSPALATADVGISMQSGTDIAMNSADVVLLSENLNKIADLFTISKHTIANIKQNLFWAFFYNCLMIPIAFGALRFVGISINPMIAGIAMVASSLTVVLNALRLKFIKLK